MSDEAKIILKDMQIEEMRKEIISQDQFIAQLEKEYDKEIERLNNTINGVEDLLKRFKVSYSEIPIQIVLNEIRELKGSDKE